MIRTAWRVVRPDFTSFRGFTWPFPGGTVETPGPFTLGDACPSAPGDGVCLAKTWQGAASGGIPASTVLIVEYDDADVLGEDENKLRVSRCVVTDVLDVRAMIRGGWFAGADLSHAYLRGADLRYADLRGADLRYADLRYADLRGADLRYADWRGAALRYADLRGANWRYADLSCADLSYADLSYASLRGVIGLDGAH